MFLYAGGFVSVSVQETAAVLETEARGGVGVWILTEVGLVSGIGACCTASITPPLYTPLAILVILAQIPQCIPEGETLGARLPSRSTVVQISQ